MPHTTGAIQNPSSSGQSGPGASFDQVIQLWVSRCQCSGFWYSRQICHLLTDVDSCFTRIILLIRLVLSKVNFLCYVILPESRTYFGTSLYLQTSLFQKKRHRTRLAICASGNGLAVLGLVKGNQLAGGFTPQRSIAGWSCCTIPIQKEAWHLTTFQLSSTCHLSGSYCETNPFVPRSKLLILRAVISLLVGIPSESFFGFFWTETHEATTIP